VALIRRPNEVQEPVTTATMIYHEMGMRFWLEQAEAEMRFEIGR